MNGCGGEGSWIRPPYRIFFEASCNKHDKSYEEGGNAARRLECDTKFFAMMMKDTWKKKGIKRLYYQCWAIIYYLGVRLGGKKYFNYK